MELRDQPPLIQAIFERNVDAVRSLIVRGEDANVQDMCGRSPLHAAAYVGNSEIADILLLSGARVNKKDKSFATPLHRACRNGHNDVVEVLLKHGADSGQRNRNFETPLHTCAANDAVQCASFIFNVGGEEIDVPDKQGATPLFHAAFFGSFEMTEFLLSKGADPNRMDKKERRPIHLASFRGHWDIVQLLLDAGAMLEPRDVRGMTPLHYAAFACKATVINLFLKGPNGQTVDVNCQSKNGDSALHMASRNGHLSIVHELLAAGAVIELRNRQGMTPLHFAVSSPSKAFACAESLLEKKADPNAFTYCRTTPLHIVSEFGRDNIARLLLKFGADVNATNEAGNTPLHISALFSQELCVSLFISHQASLHTRNIAGMIPLHVAAYQGYIRPIEALLSADKSPTESLRMQDAEGRNPLHLACASSNPCIEPLQLFLNSGMDSLIKDNEARLPLHYACKASNFKRIKKLVEDMEKRCGREKPWKHWLNSEDLNGRTPLHYVAFSDKDGSSTQLMLQRGASPSIRDHFGLTALEYTAYVGNERAFTQLSDVCDDIKGAIHLAASQGHPKIIEKLLKRPMQSKSVVIDKRKSANGVSVNSPQETRNPLWETDKRGCTALHWASYKGHSNCIRALLAGPHPAPLLVGEKIRGLTPLHIAAGFGHLDCLRLMIAESDGIESSEALSTADIHMRTPLMLSVSSGSEETVDYILSQEVAVSTSDFKGRNSLHRASALGLHEVFKRLVTEGEPLSTLDLYRRLPLHYAMLGDQRAMVKAILNDLPKDVEVTSDKLGLHPVHWAAFYGDHFSLNLLLEQFGSSIHLIHNRFTPAHCAVIHENVTSLQIVVDVFGKEVLDWRDQAGRSPLHIAAVSGSERCAALLIELNAPLNIQDFDGRTPLSLSKNVSIAALMLKRGASLELRDYQRRSALHHACLQRKESLACELIKHSSMTSDILNLQDCDGKTALHLGAKRGLVSVVEALILAGASVFVSDDSERTPALECASDENVADCLELILIAMIPDNPQQSKRLSSRISYRRTSKEERSQCAPSNTSSDSEFY